VVLTKDNLPEMEEEYALFGEKFLLPKTIMDAIKLCQDIGQKYLWVDCLCILQDEEEDKYSQIGSMDAVYNLAFLTIIAASGDDANTGLSPFISARLIPDRSIYVETISCKNFLSSLSPLHAAEVIAKSKWATRGWTLQEYVLSKRSVIFTGQYVFFRCEEALWGEDFGLHLSSFCDNRLDWDLPLYRISITPQSAARHYPESYSRLAAQYIRRNLTNQEDILDAFLGILRHLETSIGPHLWGMPSKEFGSALLWLTNQSFPAKRRPSFPSWSWAGWIHTATVQYGKKHAYDDIYQGFGSWHEGILLTFDSWYESSSILTCFKIGDDAKIHCFEENNIDRIFKIQLRAVREGKAIEEHFTPPLEYKHILSSYISAKTGLGPPISHSVFFWTSCGTLRVARQPRHIWKSDLIVEEFAIYRNTTTFDSYDNYYAVGFARLDISWREKQPDMLEFAVTTIGIERDVDKVWVNLGLMLIESSSNSAPKTYMRVPGVRAIIDQQSWSKVKPQQRLLALV
jgi:hypothetical protein